MKTHQVLLLIGLMSIPSVLWAADGSTGTGHFDYRQKAETKQSSRWTLQEWLAQKDRNKMMDLWLAMYSPSPYEFFIGGAYQDFTSQNDVTKSQSRYNSGMGSAGAYATLIGLEGFYENNSQEKISQSGGSLNLRVLGNAVQGTHLSFNYGYRSLSTMETGTPTVLNQTFAGADLNLYLNRYFGFAGMYRSYLPAKNDNMGSVMGSRAEAGLYIDFDMVRVSGSWYSDQQISKPNGVDTTVTRSGAMAGLKFFF